jgi:hypothetical protein
LFSYSNLSYDVDAWNLDVVAWCDDDGTAAVVVVEYFWACY